jgi:hypothetical protein
MMNFKGFGRNRAWILESLVRNLPKGAEGKKENFVRTVDVPVKIPV